jgi:Domain of unknown function (DUF4352)
LKKWITGGAVLLAVSVATAGCASVETPSKDSAAKSSASGAKTEKKKQSCGTKATDNCTPHVGQTGTVRVDALYWQVKSVKTAKTIGDMTYGLGQKADGVFVVVGVKVRSAKSKSATLTDNAFQLEVNGKTYDPDTDGTVAAVGAGENPFFLEDIGPDATTRGKVVFDVPKSVLKKKVELRFNELGFGSTHAYVKLSSLAA